MKCKNFYPIAMQNRNQWWTVAEFLEKILDFLFGLEENCSCLRLDKVIFPVGKGHNPIPVEGNKVIRLLCWIKDGIFSQKHEIQLVLLQEDLIARFD